MEDSQISNMDKSLDNNQRATDLDEVLVQPEMFKASLRVGESLGKMNACCLCTSEKKGFDAGYCDRRSADHGTRQTFSRYRETDVENRNVEHYGSLSRISITSVDGEDIDGRRVSDMFGSDCVGQVAVTGRRYGEDITPLCDEDKETQLGVTYRRESPCSADSLPSPDRSGPYNENYHHLKDDSLITGAYSSDETDSISNTDYEGETLTSGNKSKSVPSSPDCYTPIGRYDAVTSTGLLPIFSRKYAKRPSNISLKTQFTSIKCEWDKVSSEIDGSRRIAIIAEILSMIDKNLPERLFIWEAPEKDPFKDRDDEDEDGPCGCQSELGCSYLAHQTGSKHSEAPTTDLYDSVAGSRLIKSQQQCDGSPGQGCDGECAEDEQVTGSTQSVSASSEPSPHHRKECDEFPGQVCDREYAEDEQVNGRTLSVSTSSESRVFNRKECDGSPGLGSDGECAVADEDELVTGSTQSVSASSETRVVNREDCDGSPGQVCDRGCAEDEQVTGSTQSVSTSSEPSSHHRKECDEFPGQVCDREYAEDEQVNGRTLSVSTSSESRVFNRKECDGSPGLGSDGECAVADEDELVTGSTQSVSASSETRVVNREDCDGSPGQVCDRGCAEDEQVTGSTQSVSTSSEPSPHHRKECDEFPGQVCDREYAEDEQVNGRTLSVSASSETRVVNREECDGSPGQVCDRCCAEDEQVTGSTQSVSTSSEPSSHHRKECDESPGLGSDGECAEDELVTGSTLPVYVTSSNEVRADSKEDARLCNAGHAMLSVSGEQLTESRLADISSADGMSVDSRGNGETPTFHEHLTTSTFSNTTSFDPSQTASSEMGVDREDDETQDGSLSSITTGVDPSLTASSDVSVDREDDETQDGSLSPITTGVDPSLTAASDVSVDRKDREASISHDTLNGRTLSVIEENLSVCWQNSHEPLTDVTSSETVILGGNLAVCCDIIVDSRQDCDIRPCHNPLTDMSSETVVIEENLSVCRQNSHEPSTDMSSETAVIEENLSVCRQNSHEPSTDMSSETAVIEENLSVCRQNSHEPSTDMSSETVIVVDSLTETSDMSVASRPDGDSSLVEPASDETMADITFSEPVTVASRQSACSGTGVISGEDATTDGPLTEVTSQAPAVAPSVHGRPNVDTPATDEPLAETPDTPADVTPEMPDTPANVTSEMSDTPANVTSEMSDTPANVTSEMSDTPANVTSEMPDTPANVTSEMPDTPADVTSEMPDTSADFTSEMPDTPANVTSEMSYTPADVTSEMPDTSADVTSEMPDTSADVTSEMPDTPADVTSDMPDTSADVTSEMPDTPADVTSEMPDTSADVTSEMPDTPAKVTSEMPKTSPDITSEMSDTPVNVTSEMPYTPADVTSEMSDTPANVTSKTPDTPADVTSKTSDTPADVTSEMSDTPADVKSEMPDTPANVTSEMPHTSANVTSEMPHTSADVTSEMPDTPADVTSEMPDTSADVTSEMPDTPADVTSETPDTPAHITSEMPDSPTDVTSVMSDTPAEVTSEMSDTPVDITSEMPDTPADVTSETPDTPADVTSKTSDTPADVTSEMSDTSADVTSETPDTPADVKSEMPDTHANVTSEMCDTPAKVTSEMPKTSADITSEMSDTPVNVTSEMSDTPADVTSEMSDTPADVTSEMPDTPANVTSETPETPADVTSEMLKTSAHVTSEMSDTPADVTSEMSDTPADVTSEMSDTPADVTSETPDTPAKVTSEMPKTSADVTSKTPDTPANVTSEMLDTPADVTSEMSDTPIDVTSEMPDTPTDVTSETPDTPAKVTSEMPKTSGDVLSEMSDTSVNVTSEMSDTPADVTSETPDTPAKVTSEMPKTSGDVLSEMSDTSAKVTSEMADTPADVTSEMPDTSTDVTSETPDTPADVTSEMLDTPADVTSETPDTPAHVTSETPDTPADVTSEMSDTPADITSANVTSEMPDTSANVTSEMPDTPANVTSEMPDTPANVTSEMLDTPADVTSEMPDTPIDVTSEMPDTPIDVTSEMPDTPIDVTSEMPDTPADVTSATPDTLDDFTSEMPYTSTDVTFEMPPTPVDVTSEMPDTPASFEMNVNCQTGENRDCSDVELPGNRKSDTTVEDLDVTTYLNVRSDDSPTHTGDKETNTPVEDLDITMPLNVRSDDSPTHNGIDCSHTTHGEDDKYRGDRKSSSRTDDDGTDRNTERDDTACDDTLSTDVMANPHKIASDSMNVKSGKEESGSDGQMSTADPGGTVSEEVDVRCTKGERLEDVEQLSGVVGDVDRTASGEVDVRCSKGERLEDVEQLSGVVGDVDRSASGEVHVRCRKGERLEDVEQLSGVVGDVDRTASGEVDAKRMNGERLEAAGQVSVMMGDPHRIASVEVDESSLKEEDRLSVDPLLCNGQPDTGDSGVTGSSDMTVDSQLSDLSSLTPLTSPEETKVGNHGDTECNCHPTQIDKNPDQPEAYEAYPGTNLAQRTAAHRAPILCHAETQTVNIYPLTAEPIRRANIESDRRDDLVDSDLSQSHDSQEHGELSCEDGGSVSIQCHDDLEGFNTCSPSYDPPQQLDPPQTGGTKKQEMSPSDQPEHLDTPQTGGTEKQDMSPSDQPEHLDTPQTGGTKKQQMSPSDQPEHLDTPQTGGTEKQDMSPSDQPEHLDTPQTGGTEKQQMSPSDQPEHLDTPQTGGTEKQQMSPSDQPEHLDTPQTGGTKKQEMSPSDQPEHLDTPQTGGTEKQDMSPSDQPEHLDTPQTGGTEKQQMSPSDQPEHLDTPQTGGTEKQQMSPSDQPEHLDTPQTGGTKKQEMSPSDQPEHLDTPQTGGTEKQDMSPSDQPEHLDTPQTGGTKKQEMSPSDQPEHLDTPQTGGTKKQDMSPSDQPEHLDTPQTGDTKKQEMSPSDQPEHLDTPQTGGTEKQDKTHDKQLGQSPQARPMKYSDENVPKLEDSMAGGNGQQRPKTICLRDPHHPSEHIGISSVRDEEQEQHPDSAASFACTATRDDKLSTRNISGPGSDCQHLYEEQRISSVIEGHGEQVHYNCERLCKDDVAHRSSPIPGTSAFTRDDEQLVRNINGPGSDRQHLYEDSDISSGRGSPMDVRSFNESLAENFNRIEERENSCRHRDKSGGGYDVSERLGCLRDPGNHGQLPPSGVTVTSGAYKDVKMCDDRVPQNHDMTSDKEYSCIQSASHSVTIDSNMSEACSSGEKHVLYNPHDETCASVVPINPTDMNRYRHVELIEQPLNIMELQHSSQDRHISAPGSAFIPVGRNLTKKRHSSGSSISFSSNDQNHPRNRHSSGPCTSFYPVQHNVSVSKDSARRAFVPVEQATPKGRQFSGISVHALAEENDNRSNADPSFYRHHQHLDSGISSLSGSPIDVRKGDRQLATEHLDNVGHLDNYYRHPHNLDTQCYGGSDGESHSHDGDLEDMLGERRKDELAGLEKQTNKHCSESSPRVSRKKANMIVPCPYEDNDNKAGDHSRSESQNVSSASQQNVSSASQQNVPSASQQNVPSASQQNVPSASQQNVPSASQQNVPSASQQNVPSASQQNVPSASKQNVQYDRTVEDTRRDYSHNGMDSVGSYDEPSVGKNPESYECSRNSYISIGAVDSVPSDHMRNREHSGDVDIHSVDASMHSVDASMQSVDASMHCVDHGMQSVNAGMQSVDEGMQSVDEGMQSVDEGMHSVDVGMHSVDVGMHSVDEDRHSVDEGMHSVDEGMHSVDSKPERNRRGCKQPPFQGNSVANDRPDDEKADEPHYPSQYSPPTMTREQTQKPQVNQHHSPSHGPADAVNQASVPLGNMSEKNDPVIRSGDQEQSVHQPQLVTHANDRSYTTLSGHIRGHKQSGCSAQSSSNSLPENRPQSVVLLQQDNERRDVPCRTEDGYPGRPEQLHSEPNPEPADQVPRPSDHCEDKHVSVNSRAMVVTPGSQDLREDYFSQNDRNRCPTDHREHYMDGKKCTELDGLEVTQGQPGCVSDRVNGAHQQDSTCKSHMNEKPGQWDGERKRPREVNEFPDNSGEIEGFPNTNEVHSKPGQCLDSKETDGFTSKSDLSIKPGVCGGMTDRQQLALNNHGETDVHENSQGQPAQVPDIIVGGICQPTSTESDGFSRVRDQLNEPDQCGNSDQRQRVLNIVSERGTDAAYAEPDHVIASPKPRRRRRTCSGNANTSIERYEYEDVKSSREKINGIFFLPIESPRNSMLNILENSSVGASSSSELVSEEKRYEYEDVKSSREKINGIFFLPIESARNSMLNIQENSSVGASSSSELTPEEKTVAGNSLDDLSHRPQQLCVTQDHAQSASNNEWDSHASRCLPHESLTQSGQGETPGEAEEGAEHDTEGEGVSVKGGQAGGGGEEGQPDSGQKDSGQDSGQEKTEQEGNCSAKMDRRTQRRRSSVDFLSEDGSIDEGRGQLVLVSRGGGYSQLPQGRRGSLPRGSKLIGGQMNGDSNYLNSYTHMHGAGNQFSVRAEVHDSQVARYYGQQEAGQVSRVPHHHGNAMYKQSPRRPFSRAEYDSSISPKDYEEGHDSLYPMRDPSGIRDMDYHTSQEYSRSNSPVKASQAKAEASRRGVKSYDGPVSVQDPVDIMNSQDGGGQSEAKTASSSNQHSSSTNQHQASSHASSNHSHSAAANENQAQAQINGTVVEDRKNLRNLPIEEVIEKTKSIVGELGKLEDYHRGEGMRLQKMLGDFYWDYTSQRKQIGDAIAEAGYAEITIKMLKSLNTIGIFKNDEIWFPAYYTYNTTWNYSDTSDLLARNLAEADAVRLLSLNCSHKPYITNIHSKNVFYVMKASMSILHNIARNPNVKGFFKENKTAEVIMPFINMNDDMLRVLAMLTLAYIVEEEDNSKLIDETGTIKNVVMWIGKALDNPKRRFKGFTPQELTQGLDKLAVNDGNKLKIIEEGSIPLFMKMLLSDNDKEQSTTARCVWTLAFDKDVRKELFETENMMSTLEKLLENQHKDVKKNAQGALWVLTGKGDAPTDKTKGPPRGKNHIFISYSWNEQEKVLEIRDKLRAEGYIVWVDVDEMGGSTLQAMAEAVENAAVVLVCMSEKYKQSPNCRTEAEYTFQLRKDYIPLMMQKKYRPDGWLGMILGAKLFFDFSGKYPFEKSMSGMLKELRGRGKRSNVLQSQSTDQVDALESTTENRLVHAGNPHRNTHPGTELAIPQGHQPLTHNMSRDDVQRWLVTHQLDGSIAAFSQFDGRLLWQLREMKQEAPDYFYQCLEKKLFMNLIDMLRLASALDTLH